MTGSTLLRTGGWALLAFAGFASLPSSAVASDHAIEVDGAFGYQFGGSLDVELEGDAGRLSLDGGPAFSAIVSHRVHASGFVFLNYTRQRTTLRYRELGSAWTEQASTEHASTEQAELNTEYFQFGGNLEGGFGAIVPYFGLSLGATRFVARDFGDEWRFSFVADGGVKLVLTHWLHLRAFGRVPITILEGNSTVLCVSEGGCVVRMSGTPLVQGALFVGVGLDF